MEWIGAVRYWVAVALYSSLPAGILYWYLIHPLTAFWRRLGPKRTFWLVGLVFAAVVLLFASQHQRVLATSYPFNWPLAAAGLVLYAVAVALERACRRHLKFAVLAGAPQIGDDPGRLLTEGIYSRVRNPRYLSLIFGVTGFTLILNYPALYVALVLFVPAIYGVILLEERELRDRFGTEYEEYVRRVPRLVPKRGRKAGEAPTESLLD